MNIIIEGNPYLRKLAIDMLINYQFTESSKYIKYFKNEKNIGKSMLSSEVKKIIDNPIATPLYLINESTNEKIELNKEIDISKLENLTGNFYSIFYEEMEYKSVYLEEKPLLFNNCKLIQRTYQNLTPSEYKKYFSSLYEIIPKQSKKNNENQIEKEDEVKIENYIIEKSPFSFYVDDIRYEKFTLEELQNFKNLEDLFEKEKREIKTVVDLDKKDDSILYEKDVKQKEIVINSGLSKNWVNDLLYLKVNQNNILNQIEYKNSKLSTSDLQEIVTSIVDNDIIFINLTNISEEGYNRYVSIDDAPFTEEEQKRIKDSSINTSLLLSELNASDTLYNSINIKNMFKYKKPTVRKKNNGDFKINVDVDNYSQKFNSEKIYKNYFEINIPFSQKLNTLGLRVINLDSIKESLYKKLKEIIDIQKDFNIIN